MTDIDRDALISGDAPWGFIRETEDRPCQWLCWRWLDIGGGGPGPEVEPGSALFDPDIECERILAMTEEELYRECRANGEDPQELAERTRQVIERALAEYDIPKDADVCPITGIENCTYCSGELCAIHSYQSCGCDVLERHAGLESQKAPETPQNGRDGDL